MRDWKQYVRDRLPALGLSGAREQEIVEELAQQLDEAAAEALISQKGHGKCVPLPTGTCEIGGVMPQVFTPTWATRGEDQSKNKRPKPRVR